MPGFKIMLQNEEGLYSNSTHALKFEGDILIYNPQKDSAQWVPMWGMSMSLTSSELRSANDLNNMNPHPIEWPGFVILQSPLLVHGIPMGAEESNSDSCGKPTNSGEEWDKTETSDWSRCLAPPRVKVPTWAEAHAETRRRVFINKDAATWEEVTSSSLQKKQSEKEDSD